ncbi:DUF6476 family protein [Rhodobacter capsulatus]|uniref:Uncharacterized protein n=1 Tax=Rhodobacter capsulatus (strain ATCC BAA-309 / NBRC 16581 / SB1003) TaxID=272942 RepID=D5AP33_RHOCB|nr:DUF6476 family protein [Rhodobacter capsulatus]ADE86538.1 conserved hypothetical protein [Rhodobacter capsulatus SB 1003]ETD00769.1 hypothetical protein U714_15450 [Rhodobacter capsulatus DE442]ETD75400.1 hypothetical protein U717_15605 [Rhodobacter capsulatus R121]ETD90935.1 hypothetical protein U713_03765 [Rhodobacter capsulatus YW2]ETE52830.1 hypothetical protein U715_15590 [Rhodobacter capsulatus Y262]
MSDMMPSDPAPPPEVKFLKILTTTLAGVMIFGLLTIIFLLVTRLPGATKLPALPAAITLPAGEKAEAVTFGRGFTVVVTESGRVLVYRPDGGLAQDVALK